MSKGKCKNRSVGACIICRFRYRCLECCVETITTHCGPTFDIVKHDVFQKQKTLKCTCDWDWDDGIGEYCKITNVKCLVHG